MVRVVIEGRRYTLDAKAVLGIGGEATVYRHGSWAVKIYHPGDAAVIDRKIAKLSAFPTNLPDAVVAPRAVVFDGNKRAIGYAMDAIQGGVEIASLSKRSYRDGVVSNDMVMRIFSAFAKALSALHAAGVVVGDLNDGNILVVGDEVRFIDVDSMQFGSYPCPVAHERFLDPRLYGVDLTAAPRFSPENDWYAFMVHLFSALLYVHPFGGVHPKVATFLRRAEAGISLLSQLVKAPKVAADPNVLPDGVRETFVDWFDRNLRPGVDDSLLKMSWTRCSCGVEHARHVCPRCASAGRISPRPVADHHGACRVTSVFSTAGRIVAAIGGGRVCWLVEEGGVLSREDGRVFSPSLGAGTRYALTMNTTWAETPSALFRSTSGGPFERLGPASPVAPWPSGCVQVVDDWLVESTTGERIGPVLSGTTWIRTGSRLGFGFYRAGLVTKYFVFRPGRAGLTFVDLPSIRGHVRTAEAVFDDRTIVFSLVVDFQGRTVSHLFIIGADGKPIASLVGAPDSNRIFAAPRGRCVMGGQVVTATDDGLVLLAIDRGTGAVSERTLFQDTEPFVSADALLLPADDGAVHVVTQRDIKTLALS